MDKAAPIGDRQAPDGSGVSQPAFFVRGLAAGDTPFVLRINSDGYPGVARLDDPELRRLCGLRNYHLIAEDLNGLVVGYCLAFARETAYDGEEFQKLRLLIPDPFLYIDQVAITKESKGRGVGRMLYGALETIARTAGAQALCCEVNTVPPNPGSMAFHQALGFRRLCSLTTSDGRQVELLQKPLI